MSSEANTMEVEIFGTITISISRTVNMKVDDYRRYEEILDAGYSPEKTDTEIGRIAVKYLSPQIADDVSDWGDLEEITFSRTP